MTEGDKDGRHDWSKESMGRQSVAEVVSGVLVCAVVLGWVTTCRDVENLRRELNAVRLGQEEQRKRSHQTQTAALADVTRLTGQVQALQSSHFAPRAVRNHRSSFVPVYAYFREGKTLKANYGTASYLGSGYFITSKHIVAPYSSPGKPSPPPIIRIQTTDNGQTIDLTVVDTGDAVTKGEISLGDWAVLWTPAPPAGLRALKVAAGYVFHFGDPLIRFGNDYNHGIAASAGYAGQTSEGGWTSWLIDLHPGASGGGVLNTNEELVGLNGGALDGDNRLGVIIPIQPEMLRCLSRTDAADASSVAVAPSASE